MTQQRNILTTAALIYANGPIHLGHMVEYIQADIWVRFQRMRGHNCYYICGNDAHGTPIMLRAEREGISAEQLIDKFHQQHSQDFADFTISFDNFYTTHSQENKQLVENIYQQLQAKGDIEKRTIKQAFDPEKQMFLPDRYVKGECPKCGAADQYGDSCEKCGATYSPIDMINPISVVSGATPIAKQTEHFFFKLGNYEKFLQQWLKQSQLQPEIVNKLQEWFDDGLQAWCISRDKPYFGFLIPGTTDKYFYVWMDAPVGYLASFKKYCENSKLDFDTFWNENANTELYHFIGKDIVYFHTLFWPAILHAAKLKLPNAVYAHGFLTVNGQKMSKSRGTFITARSYLDHLEADYLRYYYAAKLGSGVDDIDLNFTDFKQRVNADLVGKIVNIASRTASFINKKFDNCLSVYCTEQALVDEFIEAGDEIANYYEKREYNRAIRTIMALADKANQYIDQHKPWELIKHADKEQQVQNVCSVGINLFKILMTYLKPVVPTLTEKVEAFLQTPEFTWDNRKDILLDHTVGKFKPLLQRIEDTQLDVLQEAARMELDKEQKLTQTSKDSSIEAIADEIEFDDFNKVDLRIAKIVKAEHVEGAEKLLKLQLDIGNGSKQVFAGIKKYYKPEDIEGKLTVMVANLKPRKMRFGLSEGMVILAGDGESLWLIEPQDGAKPGMRVK